MGTFTFTGLSALDLTVPESFFILYDQLLSDLALENVFAHATDVLRKVMQAERATVYLLHKDTDELESNIVSRNVNKTIRVAVDPRSLAGYCARSGRSFVVPDAYGDLRHVHPDLVFDRRWDQSTGFRTQDVMCAPVQYQGELQGVVQVINSLGNGFKQSDLMGLESVARVVGYAMGHARLYDDLASMKQLEKKKAQFMRVLVHELKSPLAAVRTMVDAYTMVTAAAARKAAAEESESARERPDRATPLFEKIGTRLDGMLGMVGDILEHSKVKQGDAIGEVMVLDVTEALKGALEPWLEQSVAKGLELRVRVDPHALLVRVDASALALVFSNLISNAIKYTEHGVVDVRLEREGKAVALRVRDSGIGIPREELPKLFKEFFRASNARKAGIAGSGEGLAGVKEIVERFGGSLGVDSDIGQGSTFTARLPLHIPT
jgi:signal transduction histidine kinase